LRLGDPSGSKCVTAACWQCPQAGFEIFENNFGSVLTNAQTKGERIRIEGRVTDGIGTVLKDAMLEVWQANAEGKYAHPSDRQPGKAVNPSIGTSNALSSIGKAEDGPGERPAAPAAA
jgi:protocatechuate 3,4-dioxygenase beta subunit